MIIAVLAIGLIAGAVSYPTASAQSYSVPNWVKGVAGFWSEDKISEEEFVGALEFLIDNDVIIVPRMVPAVLAVEDKKGQPFEELWDALRDMQDQIDMLRVGTGVEGDLVPYWDFNNVINDLEKNDQENSKQIERIYMLMEEQNDMIQRLNQRITELEELR